MFKVNEANRTGSLMNSAVRLEGVGRQGTDEVEGIVGVTDETSEGQENQREVKTSAWKRLKSVVLGGQDELFLSEVFQLSAEI